MHPFSTGVGSAAAKKKRKRRTKAEIRLDKRKDERARESMAATLRNTFTRAANTVSNLFIPWETIANRDSNFVPRATINFDEEVDCHDPQHADNEFDEYYNHGRGN